MKKIISMLLAVTLVVSTMMGGMLDVFAEETYYEVPKDNFWGKINFSMTNGNNVQSLFDGTPANYWYFDWWQDDEQWIAIDLGEEIFLNAIKLDAPADIEGNPITRNGEILATPEAYDLYYATDSTNYDVLKGITWVDGSDGIGTEAPDLSAESPWTKLGSYTSADEMAKFDATKCRYLLINTTKTTAAKLSIGEFHAYSPYQDAVKTVDYEQEEGFITDKASWGIKAWRKHSPEANVINMVDGDVTTGYDDESSVGNMPYVIVDMGTEVSLNRVVMKWPTPNKNYMPDKVSIYTSYDKAAYDEGKDSSAWTVAADNVNVNASSIDVSFNARPARYFMIKTTELGNEFKGCTKTWIGFGEIYAYEDTSDLNLYYEVPKDTFWGKIAHSYTENANAVALFDGIKTSYYDANGTQWAGAWVAVDLGKEIELNAIRLDEPLGTGNTALAGYATPSYYDLYYMSDSSDYDKLQGVVWYDYSVIDTEIPPTLEAWTKLGSYTSADEMAKFDATTCRYLLIYIPYAADNMLAIGEFNAYSPNAVAPIDYAKESNCITDRSMWAAKAWRIYSTEADFKNLIDGDVTTGYADGTDGSSIPYVAIDMGESKTINRAAMKWAFPNGAYMPDTVNVYTSNNEAAYTDGIASNAWTLAAENVAVKASYFDTSFTATTARYVMIKAVDLGLKHSGKPQDWIAFGDVYLFETSEIAVELTAEYNDDENALNIASNADLNAFAISADDITITDANGDVPYVKDIVITDAGISMVFPFGLAVSGTYTVHIGVIDKDVEFTAEADANALYNVALTDGNGNLVKNIDNISKLKIDFDAKTTGSVQMFMAAYSGNIMQRAVRVAAEEGGAAIDVEPNTDYVKIFVWDANLAPVFEPITVGHTDL